MDIELPDPQERANQTGRAVLEKRLRQTMGEGALSHGWIIAGAPGAGKATLAYRIARGLLDPTALIDDESFEIPEAARVFHLIAAGAHPDLFVAQREWDEKKSRYKTEISIETIRKLTMFMNRTASGGGWRVAIVDTADDMNRNAANALLKVLEEPPAKVLLLLLSARPGKLLATIRSRCRRLDLPALSTEEVETLLVAEGVDAGEAKSVAAIARGRPGYALKLAVEGGVEAITMAHGFLKAAAGDGDISRYTSTVSGKNGDSHWEVFKEAIIDRLSDAARDAAQGGDNNYFPLADAGQLLTAWEASSRLLAQGEGLNLDRAQLLKALAHDLRDVMRNRAA